MFMAYSCSIIMSMPLLKGYVRTLVEGGSVQNVHFFTLFRVQIDYIQ